MFVPPNVSFIIHIYFLLDYRLGLVDVEHLFILYHRMCLLDLSPVKFYCWISSNFTHWIGFVACLDVSILCPFIRDMSLFLILFELEMSIVFYCYWICLWCLTLELSVGEGKENSVVGDWSGADPAYSWPTPGDNSIRGSYHSPGNWGSFFLMFHTTMGVWWVRLGWVGPGFDFFFV